MFALKDVYSMCDLDIGIKNGVEGVWKQKRKLHRGKMYRRFRGQRNAPARYARKK
jgi:hypothetical protein